jgi:hypothetical protein
MLCNTTRVPWRRCQRRASCAAGPGLRSSRLLRHTEQPVAVHVGGRIAARLGSAGRVGWAGAVLCAALLPELGAAGMAGGGARQG